MIQLAVNAVSVIDNVVLKDPHMALVNEAIDADKHVAVERVAHLGHFVAIAITLGFHVAFRTCHAHFLQVINALCLLSLKNAQKALEFWLRRVAQVDRRLFDFDHLAKFLARAHFDSFQFFPHLLLKELKQAAEPRIVFLEQL